MRRSLLVAVTLLAACAGAGGDAKPTTEGPSRVVFADEDLGSATLPGLGDGAAAVSLPDLRGRPVLLNFFASTCAPCVREMPAVEAAFRAAGGQIAFLGIAVADRTEEALQLVRRTGIGYPVAADPQGELFATLGAPGLPATVLLDAEGEILARRFGVVDGTVLAELLVDAGIEVTVAG